MIYAVLTIIIGFYILGLKEIVFDNNLSKTEKLVWILLVVLFNVLAIATYLLVRNFRKAKSA